MSAQRMSAQRMSALGLSARGMSRWRGAVLRVTALAIAAQLALATSAAAQATLDSSQFRKYTLGTLLERTRVGDSLASLRTAAPPVHAKLDELSARLARPELARLTLWQLGDEHASFATVARRRFVALTPFEAASLDTLAAILEEELAAPLSDAVGNDSADRVLAPLDAFNAARRQRSMADSHEKLRRFERKYGPDAPVRNVAEVALNYAAQFVPGFQPSGEGWPSRAELIASYVPTYLSLPRDGRSQAVTVAEAGVRLYLWREGWGGTDGGVLRPGFISLGVVAAGERDGALGAPWQGASRFGAFVGWGNAKIAVVGGRNTRVLITRQVHVLPFVF
jgi:hypothetical protein